LDEVYHGGLKEVINDNLSPAENALISGVGLLDEYGLSEEKFREWLEKLQSLYVLYNSNRKAGDAERFFVEHNDLCYC
ncbi:hypothetical protein GT986_10275, partial [Bifidobacterium pseudocatenulatum]|nr:hypothetical protein [Bifidobacterium pseudocatenulatum]